jgi:hypothetical protein
MKCLLPFLLFSVLLIPVAQEANAQQGTLSKIGQEIREFTHAASEKLRNAGEKVEGIINNATSESNRTAENFSQGVNNTAAEAIQPLNNTRG